MQNVIGHRVRVVQVVPTVSVSPAYTANDQVGGLQTIALPTGVTFTSVKIHKVVLIDASKQSASTNVYFFSAAPTLNSVDNAALNITSPQMVSNYKGVVNIAAASYITSAGVTVGESPTTHTGIYIVPSSLSVIYAIAQTAGTPTYSGTSVLTFQYQLEFHF